MTVSFMAVVSASPVYSLDCPLVVSGDLTLQEDVVCTSAVPSEAVSLDGTLRLNGFTVDANGLVNIVVDCSLRRCRVIGPGTITGAIVGINASKVLLSDGVSVSGNSGTGIQAPLVKVTDSSVAANSGTGIFSFFAAPGKGSRVVLRNANISGNSGPGVDALKNIKARESTIDNNSESGLFSLGKVVVKDSSITGNGQDGVDAHKRAKLKDSTVTGNALDVACGVSLECADVSSRDIPKLSNTTCGTSRKNAPGDVGMNWGVCSLD